MNKVLIVDDDILSQKALKKIVELKEEFVVMDTLSSGEEAVSYCKQYSPDIIFMDIMMPGINGLVAAEKIKKILPDTDICIVSAYQNLGFVKQALKLDIKDYLTKPVSVEMIHNVLKGYQSQTQDNSQDIIQQIREIIEAKNYQLVYEKPEKIAKEINVLAKGDKDEIAKLLHNIEKFLISNYFENPFEQVKIMEQFPINQELLDDEIVLEMWITKVMDYVYKYRFIERYASAKPVFDYIDEHIKDYISMLSIIENCHISQQYVLRLFKEQMKMSTLDYIQTRKIMLAKWYFYLGDYSTIDVAMMLGYGDAGYFAKVFKKYVAVTPYQYKNSIKEKAVSV